jgi:glycosyltransferase involved in cell wall biosynthesis
VHSPLSARNPAEAAVLERAASKGADRPLRLLALVPRPTGASPGQRYRIEQWAPVLAARHGITVDFAPFESPGLSRILYQPGHTAEKIGRVSFDFVRRLSAVTRARRYDGALVYREASLVGPAFYERLLTGLKIPFFFDFDDAIWLEGQPGASANGLFSRMHFWGKTSTNCRLASAVLVGNAYLAAYAAERNSKVFILPSTIDLAKYPVQPEPAPDSPFVICWTGSASTLAHFETARAALERFAAQRPTVIRIICSHPPERPIAGAENVFVPWSEQGEAEAVGACHVGIMPLPDNQYTQGKCGMKALQYMATGRPVVIAPVGMNRDLVKHGENGFLASTDDEWVDALTRLADSPDLRRRMGGAGRRTVEDHYSGEAVAAKFAEAIRSTIG